MQITAGAPLPKSLTKAGYRSLRDQSSSTYAKLFSFAFDKACTPTKIAKGIYPKKGAAIAKALKEFEINGFSPGANGGDVGFVLPDKKSFDAGAKDVLCIFGLAPANAGPTAGDVRKLETSDPVSYRDCYVVPEGSQAPEPTSCLNTHREEVLFNVVMDVTGQPSDTTSWSDENWAEYDEACASLTSILIGGTQPHLVTRAEYPDPNRPLVSAPPSASTATARVFSCFVRPDSDGQLPAGTVVGRGSSLIEIIP